MDQNKLTELINSLNLNEVSDDRLEQFIGRLDKDAIMNKLDELK